MDGFEAETRPAVLLKKVLRGDVAVGMSEAIFDFVLPGLGHIKMGKYSIVQGGLVLAGSALLGLFTAGVGYVASGIYHAAKTYRAKR